MEPNEETTRPLMIIDTQGCDNEEMKSNDDESKANIGKSLIVIDFFPKIGCCFAFFAGEVRLVYLHVRRLVESGVPATAIAAISPYNLQVRMCFLC